MRWKLFFIAEPVDDGNGNITYTVGEYTVSKSKVVVMASEGAYDLFCYVTANGGIASNAYTMDEFVGLNGPIDIVTRAWKGLSNAATVNQVKHMIGAHWFSAGEWHFGDIHAWETAGELEPMYFQSFRKILGVDWD